MERAHLDNTPRHGSGSKGWQDCVPIQKRNGNNKITMKQAEMLCAINNSVGARVQRLENTAVSAPLTPIIPFGSTMTSPQEDMYERD